jgi:hypothetical protein
MNTNNGVLDSSHDHIMANTWRLIFERHQPSTQLTLKQAALDFSILEQLLPEYRLIGLSLASRTKQRRLS